MTRVRQHGSTPHSSTRGEPPSAQRQAQPGKHTLTEALAPIQARSGFSNALIHQSAQAEAVGATAYQGEEAGDSDALIHQSAQAEAVGATAYQGEDADGSAIDVDPALEPEAGRLGGEAARGRVGSEKSDGEDGAKSAGMSEAEKRSKRTPEALQGFEYCYRRTYRGVEALIAAIVVKYHFQGTAGDYGVDLINLTIEKMSSCQPPDQAADQIIKENGDYCKAVLEACKKAVVETHGEKGMGTQLGNTQAVFGGLVDIGTNVMLDQGTK